ncbi:MAG: hypothetical protein KF830_15535 [Planctomycetes bacterium]|nr:hypothetical protein [Planctomycetota bacterium]
MAAQVEIPACPPTLPVPTTLHVGSGKNFKPAWLNLDVDPRWRPDIVFDLGQPLPPDGQLRFATARFGEVTLGPDCCREVVAQDVLEHIRDLPAAMTTLLHWLQVGGVLKVAVPHELSLGAWSDPTHVRAFNERSFDYFTKWSWYLGWRTHHFALRRLDFIASPYGQELSAQGRPLDELLRTPRAIDQIYAELEKRPLDAAGRAATDFYFERPL